MRSKGQNQSKLMRIITIPIRVLGKARDLYVRSLTSCSQSGGYGNSMTLATGQFSSLPRSFSAASSRSEDTEDYRELLRAASVRSLGHRNEIDMFLRQQILMKHHHQSSAMMGPIGLPKSSTVAMGRIDEDKPCEFGEEEEEEKEDGKKARGDLLYPRSKSYAVAKGSSALF